MTSLEESVSFTTLDRLNLRGTLYPAVSRGPAIIMTPGFNCVTSMLGLPDVAAEFQRKKYTTLLYDPRNIGSSEGQPRNDIDPVLQASDYSDAVTFLSSHALVDPSRIYIWGMSFSAAVALCTAAVDKRIRGVVAVAPLTDFTLTSDKRAKVLARCMQDRASQVAGNEPFYLPTMTSSGENPAGFGSGIDREQYSKVVEAGKEIARGHVNRTTIQTYYKMIMWQPFSLWEIVTPTPVLFVVPELDQLSPPERQKHHFTKMGEPKKLFVQEGVGHMEITEGSHLPSLVQVMVKFLEDAAAAADAM
ncbi:DltD N-terminal domain protein [Penicillium angulare]|uniref:DltD N-terminal domain protein n=1 Tax=Penicillium angulare TaxID=116970 RepID=A0A9W9FHG0_9EURO|nr:DltD N-terminal domain protein [Penicillium angulare]